LQLGHLATDDAGARARLEAVLRTGAAAEKFAEMVAALGGPADLLDRPDAYLAAAPVVRAVPAPQSGVLSGMNTRAIGQLLVELGGGRRNAGDAIDHRVGLSEVLPLGVTVTTGQPLALLHAATEEGAARGIAAYRSACTLTDSPYVTSDVILDRL
jgi:thymidine phosphorylase